jgi:Mor family transcriptional regulator
MQKEIYIKIDNLNEVKNLMSEIKSDQKEIKELFDRLDKINNDENKTFENWNNYLTEISTKIKKISQ